jgi:hypothetical protein
MSDIVDLKKPSVEQVDLYLKKWDQMENYVLQENALKKLFTETYPKNSKIEDVLIKVCSLNDFYSTNIFSPFRVARRIMELNIDDAIKNNDFALINELAKVDIGHKVINFYSFATKYFSHHKPLIFPIYDSYIDRVINYFRNRDKFTSFVKNDLKDYSRFNYILNEFKKFYGLETFSIKDIDRYLWQLGKENFPRKYY